MGRHLLIHLLILDLIRRAADGTICCAALYRALKYNTALMHAAVYMSVYNPVRI
jgi:hypothetical protein